MKNINVIGTKYNYRSVLSVYKPVLILLQITGFDFKVFKFRPSFNIIIKIYYICLLICTLYITIFCFILDLTYHVWTILEYSISIIILMFYKSKLTKFFNEMTKIDVYLRVHRKHYVEHKNRTYIYTIFLWIVRLIYCCFYFSMFSFPKKFFYYIILHLSSFALDMNRVWRFILLDTVRYRLKLLRIRLEEDPHCNYYLYVKNRRNYNENKIQFCLYLYRRIADMVDLITPELLNGSIFVSVVCSLPKLIINVYHILLVIEGHEETFSAGFIVMHIFQICFFIFSPCIVVEMYAVEVEKMRLFLMHRLIDEKDPKIKEDLQLFLNYTSLRTFSYKIWRCFPVNISLPIDIANMSTSYVIVLINFTHLYG
nr:gustatory receptor 48 [Papilio dardanus]